MATSTHADIWKKMSGIDVSDFVKSRGVGNRTLSWIPWSDCLALLQAHYPNFEYEFFPVTLYPDGSAEVGCEVAIGDVSRMRVCYCLKFRYLRSETLLTMLHTGALCGMSLRLLRRRAVLYSLHTVPLWV